MGVFSEIKPKNQARRNPFSLYNGFKYNTKVGMILPLKFFPTLPSSEYKFDLKALMRTQPLNTAAFAGFTFNYDVIWTPYNDHYSSFNQFIAQRLNRQHTTQPDITQIPHFKKGAFVRMLISMAVYESLAAETTWETLSELHNNQDIDITMPRFLFYSKHMPEEAMSLTCLRTLDLLEYGNYLPLVKSLVAAAKKFMDTDVIYPIPGTGGYPADAIDQKKLPYCVRYLCLLENIMGSQSVTSFGDMRGHAWNHTFDEFLAASDTCIWATSPSQLVSKYGPVAYQFVPTVKYETLWPVMTYNKAFWQFYRNEYYDIDYEYFFVAKQNSSWTIDHGSLEYVQMFNMDDISASIDPTYDTFSQLDLRLLCMFAVKPHQYKKDLFTGVLPSTQYGNVSVMETDTMFRKLFANNFSSHDISQGQVFSNSSGTLQVTTQSQTISSRDQFKFDPALAISVLELRRADAMQRFNERMLRAGNRTKDIFRAHGWEEPMSERAFEVQFMGSYDARLDLNVVAATAESGDINLGQLAANGLSVINGREIRFKSHDFGTLLVVAYIVKDAEYDAYGVNKAHSLIEAWDFPYPELQNVSLAPITKDQLTDMGSFNTVIQGYLPQNMAYKTQNDLLHGEFYCADLFGNRADGKLKPVGIFSNMVAGRKDITDGSQSLSFFYCQPSCADTIFVQHANSNQDTDPIFGSVKIDCTTVEPLDVIGLPI